MMLAMASSDDELQQVNQYYNEKTCVTLIKITGQMHALLIILLIATPPVNMFIMLYFLPYSFTKIFFYIFKKDTLLPSPETVRELKRILH